MAKAYWVGSYRAIYDEDKLKAYAALAGPAVEAGGGKFLARGHPAQVYESAANLRIVIVEFPSVEAAIATHDSPAYQEALAALADGADRELKIVEAVE